MDQINQILSSSKRVLVTSHLQPDPDAICSALGVYDYLLKVYPNLEIECLLSGESIEDYMTLKNFEKIKWVEDIADHVNNFDTLFFVDASQLNRFTKFPEKIDLTRFKSICIDHHNNTPTKFDVLLLETQEPSAAQLIYKYFFKDSRHLVDPYVAEVLLTGILSDTGMLQFVKQDSLHTFDYVKELIEISDLTLSLIEEKYFSFSASDWDIIQELTKNIVKVDDAKVPFFYSYLPREYINKYSLNILKKGKAKFLILFGISIHGYKWSVVATPETENNMKLSFRSSANGINVRLLANNFGGGGHDLASGGDFELNANENIKDGCIRLIDKIKTLL